VWFLFLIYPICSIAVLDVLNCKRIGTGSWLASDLRVVCPLFNEGAFLFSWTIISAIGYPFGIPLIMLLSLRRFGVQKMARFNSFLLASSFMTCNVVYSQYVLMQQREDRTKGFECHVTQISGLHANKHNQSFIFSLHYPTLSSYCP
jgi:hypothetical protein